MSKDHYDMVFEIDASGETLFPKEYDFISDMIVQSKSERQLSEKQQAWIDKIWRRLFQ